MSISMPKAHLILHIPHASPRIPAAERAHFLPDDAALTRELLRMTDAWTDELFPTTAFEAGRILFPVSRLVCDPERFIDDAEEPMAARGMGVVYTRTSDGTALRAPLTEAERSALLARWYVPHHDELAQRVASTVVKAGTCLIVDCHSFASRPLPHEPDQAPGRPDICIGTDGFHTPRWLRDAAVDAALASGWSVKVDSPFAGSLVPAWAYLKEKRVLSVMIEVNRRLYMDEATGERSRGFATVKSKLGRMLDAIGRAEARHSQTPRERSFFFV